MIARRLDAGAVVAGIGATLLAISLFLDWYGNGDDEGVSAWTVFEALDLLLAALALSALVTFARRAGLDRRLPDIPLLPLGALALLVVISQLLNEPPRVAGLDPEVETGAWLALAGGALMLAGAFMSLARVSLAVSVEHREPSRSSAPPTSEPGRSEPRPSGSARTTEPPEGEPAAEAETVKLPPPDRPA